VTIIAAGTCTITANQAGNGNYLAGTPVTQSFFAAKAAQTITFNALAGKSYGNPPFTVSATGGGSGNPVTFSTTTTTVCTLSGTNNSTVTIVGVGTCTITANQAGNGNYLAGTPVSRSFAVAKGNQTITFGALPGKTYGNPPFTVSATGGASGNPVTFSTTTTTICTLSGTNNSTVTIIAAGTCTITANQAGNANYNAAAPVSQSFFAAKAAQTITFNALPNKVVSDPPFTVSATGGGSGNPVTFSTLTTSVCTLSGTNNATVTIVAVGTCTITANQAGNGNYLAATPVSRSFTVANKQDQTITFPAQSPSTRAFAAGGTFPVNPLATASSGLAVTYGTATSPVCTVSGTTVTMVKAGTCTITANQAGNASFNAAPQVTQNVTITGADVALTQAAAPNPGSTGKDVIFTLTVTNNGPAAASGLTLTDTVPAGSTFIWATPGCAHAAGTVTCSVGTLANGASLAHKVVLRRATAGSITNNAAVTFAAADPASANNNSSLAVTVNASAAGVAVTRYRLYSTATAEHHFTTDLNEYNVLGASGVWVQEGAVGKVLNNPGSFNGVTAVPYYRLYDTATQFHHWTTDANEYYTLGLYPNWSQEGVDGYILPTGTTGTIQLYRLNYPPIPGMHHWTIDVNEYTTLINQFGWVGEGGSGFVIQ
jgi:uncharacterized repeat protein (TIGR01451 family)